MFSYEILESILGDAMLGDRLEKVAYNALPGALTSDMWAHQYDEQPNQVLVTKEKRNWSTNGPESNLFGLEPNFGCCTANYHQGWPKFVSSLWMAPQGGGLAAMAYGPSEVLTNVNQVAVHLTEVTNYPFGESVRLKVNPERPVRFPLLLRIPLWSNPVSISVNGFKQRNIQVGSFYRLEREWKPGDTVEAVFTMNIRVDRGFHKLGCGVSRPLVFSLKIGEKWKKLADKGQTADWSVEPKTPWNYALLSGWEEGRTRHDGRDPQNGRESVHRNRHADCVACPGPSGERLEIGGRVSRPLARKSGGRQWTAGLYRTDSLCRRQTAHHRVPKVAKK